MKPAEPQDYKKQRGKIDWLTAYAQPLPIPPRAVRRVFSLRVDQAGQGGPVYDVVDGRPFPDRIRLLTPAHGLERAETVKVRTETELLLYQQKCLDAGLDGVLLHHGRGAYAADGLAEVRQWVEDSFQAVDDKPAAGRRAAGRVVVTCKTARGRYFDVLARTARPKSGARLLVRYAHIAKTGEPVPYLPAAVGWVP